MERDKSRSLDFKQRIKQSFTPLLIHPTNREQQTDDSNPLNSSKTTESGQPNAVKTNDFEKIIAADVEELAKSLKNCKIKNKKSTKYSIRAESNCKAPNWNMSINKVFNPFSGLESVLNTPKEGFISESTLNNPEEVVDEGLYLLHPELYEPAETNPWTFHRLTKDDCQTSGNLEEISSLPANGSDNKRHLTKEEKKVLKVLKSARTFKPLDKSNLKDFDGAGVSCFKNRNIKSCNKNKKPKNIPPPGGYVCVKPLTVEDIMKMPPNLIVDECWDYDDEEW